MRLGLVCPYSLDVPGGVQSHVRGLAEELIRRDHDVSVLAPAEDGTTVPAYVVAAGRAVPVPYNGSVGRVLFGPQAGARVRRWLAEGDFDVVHLHEPAAPSLALLALGSAEVPIVATFHLAHPRSRVLSAAAGLLRPRLERISARIAVSEYARDTLVQHIGGEPVVIPNGLSVGWFRDASPRAEWQGEQTIAFVGRLDDPRKGLTVLLDAFAQVASARSGLRLLVVGGGDVEQARRRLPQPVRDQVLFLGAVDDVAKAQVLRSADVYVAPNTGGESFGIVLVEAMAAGATVLASDLTAFRRVLDDGRLGATFRRGDCAHLAAQLGSLLDDEPLRRKLSQAAGEDVVRYDWSRVGSEIERVYETVARP